MNKDIQAYNGIQTGDSKAVCELLAKEIQKGLPQAESKVWHGHPVWFLEGNPLVGYAVRKDNVQLLFWSGQSFGEPGLKPEGTFKAAELRITDVSEVNTDDLARWLQKSEAIQWDYKNIVKRRGVLERLK
ncbi:DUF1801 domain-containing protein [Candidatus Saccharibacteria bacterium]|nr:MAG: DUF1801 domain-containing protein [Candidatus Saccharibacteria bacterium]